MPAGPWSTSEPVFVEDIKGSARPAAYYLAESRRNKNKLKKKKK
jgi:hypothetical protein